MKNAWFCQWGGIAKLRGWRLAIGLAVYGFVWAALGQDSEEEPAFRWAEGLVDARPAGVGVDGFGNIYVAGTFYESQLNIGGTTLTNGALSQGFVIKLNQAGALVWARSASVNQRIYINAATIDEKTDIWLTGSFNSTNGILGATNVISSEQGSVFVAKLDRAGTTQWVIQGGGSKQHDDSSLLTVDGTGHGYLMGILYSTNGTFGQTTLTNRVSPSGDNYLAKVSPEGNFLWARLVDVPDFPDLAGIAADEEGHVYITGSITTNQNERIVVSKYAPNGDLLWVSYDGDGLRWPTFDNRGLGISVDPAGNLFVAGRFTSTNIQVGSFTLTNAPGYQGRYYMNAFVMKCDPQGNALWIRQSGGDGDEQAIGVATDDQGNCYVTGGYTSTTMTLAGLTVTNANTMDPGWFQGDSFVAKFNGDGDILWLRRAGGLGDDLGYKVAVDDVGNVLWTGFYGPDESTFDDFILPGPGGEFFGSTFIAKLETTTPPRLALRSTPGGLRLSWSALLEDFYLESTTNLNAASPWTSNTVSSVLLDDEYTVTIPPSDVRQFYRLRR